MTAIATPTPLVLMDDETQQVEFALAEYMKAECEGVLHELQHYFGGDGLLPLADACDRVERLGGAARILGQLCTPDRRERERARLREGMDPALDTDEEEES